MPDFQHLLVGRQVVYRAGHEGAEPQQGMVTSVNHPDGIAFVNYGDGSTSKATRVADLTFLDGSSVAETFDRGTGRTTKQLMDAPDEFVFVVHTRGMRDHSRMLMHKHELNKKMHVIMSTDVYHRLRGTTLPILVDHAAWPYLDDETAGFVRQHNSRIAFS